jgi:hypothetical protein
MRRLFFASAALLMFAMAYQLGVRNAGAQASPVVEAVSYDNGAVFVVVGDAWQQIDQHTGSVILSYPLPVRGPVAGIGNHLVVYRNGDLYVHEGAPGSWVLKGNFIGRR